MHMRFCDNSYPRTNWQGGAISLFAKVNCSVPLTFSISILCIVYANNEIRLWQFV